MMFRDLPTDFPMLAAIVASMEPLTITTPPDFIDEAIRLRTVFARSRPNSYTNLPVNAWRKLPYAYWLRGASSLDEIEPALVKRYWSEVLPAALVASPRRVKRWLTPLFHTYCEQFSPGEPAFVNFAEQLLSVLKQASGPFADQLRHNHRELSFFNPMKVASQLADAFADPETVLSDVHKRYLLWDGFLNSALGGATLNAALDAAWRAPRNADRQRRLIEWAKHLNVDIYQTPQRVAFAEALLLPWRREPPPDKHRAELTSFLLSNYGHPRRADPTAVMRWRGVSDQALSVLVQWLTGDTLRTFIRVLGETADEIWKYREKFWMAFHDAGHIEEAWLALGRDAFELAQRYTSAPRGSAFGRLEGAVQANQSVLLLKIGSLVFTEWSHVGSLRAFKEDAKSAPPLYLPTYQGATLRAAVSLDFHGDGRPPQLQHIGSETGWWQKRARDFIRRSTGIAMADREIL
jgi:hypothetical protein